MPVTCKLIFLTWYFILLSGCLIMGGIHWHGIHLRACVDTLLDPSTAVVDLAKVENFAVWVGFHNGGHSFADHLIVFC